MAGDAPRWLYDDLLDLAREAVRECEALQREAIPGEDAEVMAWRLRAAKLAEAAAAFLAGVDDCEDSFLAGVFAPPPRHRRRAADRPTVAEAITQAIASTGPATPKEIHEAINRIGCTVHYQVMYSVLRDRREFVRLGHGRWGLAWQADPGPGPSP